MNPTLLEALHQASQELELGRTYSCQLEGKVVEFRVLELCPDSLLAAREPIDAWVELPPPSSEPGVRIRFRSDARLPVDVPLIPSDEETG
jgi:hypothetical protein